MRRRDSPLFPDSYSFPFLLKACGCCLFPQKGQELHCLSFKLGFELDVFVQNGLISMYSLCGLMEEARRVFNLLPDEIIVSGKLSTENPHGMQVSLVENGIMITPVETMLWSKALELKGIAKFGYGLGLQKFVILSAQVRLDWLAVWDD
ncbi:hypothetical protein FEM48_Zijuj03G0140300 [Ziziphus jujuba var. spinosa]|uniref:Uncharacterized protein n=1 Tax=Ziziphus jujuba var. spinosa TaxID=714518 RepID=A0A978VQQ8_ZIZJJ|nr:hypothetical protein FEM48_Zijuj03G0140300 [Ziziphus jujuba var. spinosa]